MAAKPNGRAFCRACSIWRWPSLRLSSLRSLLAAAGACLPPGEKTLPGRAVVSILFCSQRKRPVASGGLNRREVKPTRISFPPQLLTEKPAGESQCPGASQSPSGCYFPCSMRATSLPILRIFANLPVGAGSDTTQQEKCATVNRAQQQSRSSCTHADSLVYHYAEALDFLIWSIYHTILYNKEAA